MKKLFSVGQTYSETTPESAALGDYSDTGWEIETSNDWTLKDIVRAVRDQGCDHIQGHGSYLYIYGWTYTPCYKTGTDRQLCLHIASSPRAIKRLEKIIREKVK